MASPKMATDQKMKSPLKSLFNGLFAAHLLWCLGWLTWRLGFFSWFQAGENNFMASNALQGRFWHEIAPCRYKNQGREGMIWLSFVNPLVALPRQAMMPMPKSIGCPPECIHHAELVENTGHIQNPFVMYLTSGNEFIDCQTETTAKLLVRIVPRIQNVLASFAGNSGITNTLSCEYPMKSKWTSNGIWSSPSPELSCCLGCESSIKGEPIGTALLSISTPRVMAYKLDELGFETITSLPKVFFPSDNWTRDGEINSGVSMGRYATGLYFQFHQITLLVSKRILDADSPDGIANNLKQYTTGATFSPPTKTATVKPLGFSCILNLIPGAESPVPEAKGSGNWYRRTRPWNFIFTPLVMVPLEEAFSHLGSSVQFNVSPGSGSAIQTIISGLTASNFDGEKRGAESLKIPKLRVNCGSCWATSTTKNGKLGGKVKPSLAVSTTKMLFVKSRMSSGESAVCAYKVKWSFCGGAGGSGHQTRYAISAKRMHTNPYAVQILEAFFPSTISCHAAKKPAAEQHSAIQ